MKNIYIVRMPGSGKSTLGKLIATLLNRDFLDTDEEIARKFRKTPEQIISLQGEEKFREMEKNLLEKILKASGLIVSTGGGFPVFNENMKSLNDHGVTVYLQYDAETLWKRLEHDRVRPLSSSRESTEKLLVARESIYRQAKIIIEADEDMERNIKLIVDAIRRKYPDEL